jgi:hypothetical protein
MSPALRCFLMRLIAVTVSLLFISKGVWAQKGDDREFAAARKEIEEAYARIESALREDKSLLDRMSADLKRTDAEKDPMQRKSALKAFAEKYGDQYGKYVAKAGIQMDRFVGSLNQKYPGYAFKVVNSYAVSAVKRRPKPKPGSPGRATPPAAVTRQLEFRQSRLVSCGMGSGGTAEFGARNVLTSSWSAVVGGCDTEGKLTAKVTLPQASALTLSLDFEKRIDGLAVGVVGLAVAWSSTMIQVDVTGGEQYVYFDYFFESAFAPLLWWASYDGSEDTLDRVDILRYAGREIVVEAVAETHSTSGICCNTTASSRIRFKTADVISRQ